MNFLYKESKSKKKIFFSGSGVGKGVREWRGFGGGLE